MSSNNNDAGISDPIDLVREVYVEGGDFQLMCCAGSGGSFGGGGSTDSWVTAAEVIYEFTKNPGSVVKNLITFEISKDERVELNLLNGHFDVFCGEQILHSGRKGLELLMTWKGMTFDQALEYLCKTYSADAATAMARDYIKMRIAAFEAPSKGT
jgi:hypothetical protein